MQLFDAKHLFHFVGSDTKDDMNLTAVITENIRLKHNYVLLKKLCTFLNSLNRIIMYLKKIDK